MNLTISQLEIIREALVQMMHKADDENLKREIIEITTIINEAQFLAELENSLTENF